MGESEQIKWVGAGGIKRKLTEDRVYTVQNTLLTSSVIRVTGIQRKR